MCPKVRGVFFAYALRESVINPPIKESDERSRFILFCFIYSLVTFHFLLFLSPLNYCWAQPGRCTLKKVVLRMSVFKSTAMESPGTTWTWIKCTNASIFQNGNLLTDHTLYCNDINFVRKECFLQHDCVIVSEK